MELARGLWGFGGTDAVILGASFLHGSHNMVFDGRIDLFDRPFQSIYTNTTNGLIHSVIFTTAAYMLPQYLRPMVSFICLLSMGHSIMWSAGTIHGPLRMRPRGGKKQSHSD